MDESLLNRLKARAVEYPPGEFHFPELYGRDWNALWIGDKVRIGREFLNAVRAGKLPGIEDTARKAGGGRIYRKL
ncbi:DUF1413 domain-containing protein [Salipiger abyssi]|uniref:DUF1413 domain-containing protein n=1 Tax=Salipiger abyssi TaxID=1250539 RepID=UPI001A90B6A6|nr:DUF1413 domain-containing protein [Salipiger abyssi]MBN9886034.1 DUF1413 domain-containing protein [Salipiger abyssi]